MCITRHREAREASTSITTRGRPTSRGPDPRGQGWRPTNLIRRQVEAQRGAEGRNARSRSPGVLRRSPPLRSGAGGPSFHAASRASPALLGRPRPARCRTATPMTHHGVLIRAPADPRARWGLSAAERALLQDLAPNRPNVREKSADPGEGVKRPASPRRRATFRVQTPNDRTAAGGGRAGSCNAVPGRGQEHQGAAWPAGGHGPCSAGAAEPLGRLRLPDDPEKREPDEEVPSRSRITGQIVAGDAGHRGPAGVPPRPRRAFRRPLPEGCRCPAAARPPEAPR